MSQPNMNPSRVGYWIVIVIGFLLSFGTIALYIYVSEMAKKGGGVFIAGAIFWFAIALGGVLMAWGCKGLKWAASTKAKPMFRASVQELFVYQKTTTESPVVAKVPHGSEVEMDTSDAKRYFFDDDPSRDFSWVKVRLPSGQSGYVMMNELTLVSKQ